ncbi:MAG: hypothetical protein RSC41_01080, partial [Oscillospiraceae bacterium]
CYFVLDGINDAYEWSFVAVPAQVSAGVLKNYSYKSINSFLSQTASNYDNENSADKIAEISYLAKLGSERVLELKSRVMKKFLLEKPFLEKETIKSITDKLCYDELLELSKMFGEENAPVPQLFSQDREMKAFIKNENFKI